MATWWCPSKQFPTRPQREHNCRVPGCTLCNYRQYDTSEKKDYAQIPCSMLMRMVTGRPERDEGWLEFDNLDFMDVVDDSEEKATAEGQLNDEFGINVRDYKLINYWEEPDFQDDCPQSPTRMEDRQMMARPERCPLCGEVIIHQHVPYSEKGCFCHVLPGEECMCGHCIYMRNRSHPEKLQEYLDERKRWEEEKKKKTPSQESLHKKIAERYEQHLFNKYFLKQNQQSPDDTINSSVEVLEQTLALEASLNASLNSLFDPNSSVRLLPLYETLPPRSGHSTVPGEQLEGQLRNQARRLSAVNEEINQRRRSVSNDSEPSSCVAPNEEVVERVVGQKIERVKKVVSATAVIKKFSKSLLNKKKSAPPAEDLDSTVVSAANQSHVSFAPNSSLSSSNRSGNSSLYTSALEDQDEPYVTANETLDDMSILEALEAAHQSLVAQMEDNPELARAVTDLCKAEDVVTNLSLSGGFDPEIVNQRRRHMANLRKATVASHSNPETSFQTYPEMNSTRPSFLRFGPGRNAYRDTSGDRTMNDSAFPGPGPDGQCTRPSADSSMQNTTVGSNRSARSNASMRSNRSVRSRASMRSNRSVRSNASMRSNRSVRSNASMRSNRSADRSLNQSVHNQSTRSQGLNASVNSMNSSFDPAALHRQVRQQLRDVLHNSQQVLNHTLNTSQAAGNTSVRSNVSAPPRPTSLSMTSSSIPDESILDPALVQLQETNNSSLADNSLSQLSQPFSRQNRHYQTNSASSPTAGPERYLRFRTYMAQQGLDMTVIEDTTPGATTGTPGAAGNTTAQSLRQPANPRNNTINMSTGNGLNRMFPNESRLNPRNNTLNRSTVSAINGMFQNSQNGTMNTTASSLHQSALSNNSSLHQSALSNNSSLHQSALNDTTLTSLDDISYMGDVPVPRHLSIQSSVRDLRQALEGSVIETFVRLYPTENNKDDTLQPARQNGQCCRSSQKTCNSSNGSGIVIEINANPTFVNNPSSANGDGVLLAQIESIILARQKEFERHIEALCLSKLDAAIAGRNH